MSATVHKNLVVLARVLERLERSSVRVDAQQYRAVVAHLAAELEVAPRDRALETVLEAFQSTAELYENLHYAQCGLCRSPRDHARGAEDAARGLIDAARCRPQAKPVTDA